MKKNPELSKKKLPLLSRKYNSVLSVKQTPERLKMPGVCFTSLADY
jgi:hypothetical protein